MRAVLGFLLVGGGLGVVYLVLTGKLSTLIPAQPQNLVAPVTNAGIADNTANIPTQTGSGGMSMISSWNNLINPLAYQMGDRHASRGGML